LNCIHTFTFNKLFSFIHVVKRDNSNRVAAVKSDDKVQRRSKLLSGGEPVVRVPAVQVLLREDPAGAEHLLPGVLSGHD
jgi:hypothetical protein